jgi:cytochrome c biogenesis protein CcmG, thiol:disulfide interchange protein DsbE
MRRQPAQMPQLPLHPGRGAFSRRTRLVLMLTLIAGVAVAAVLGVVLAHSSSKVRVVTIPKADRNATPALLRAARNVGFRPPQADGAGRIEDEPASAAKIFTKGLLPAGAPAPDFTLRTPTGTPVSLHSLRGKAVLLEFFATWCPHCNAEASHLQDLYARLPRAKVAFVSVDGNSDDAPSVFAYHVWYGLPFPALLDQGDRTVTFPEHGPIGPVSRRYGVSFWPTFYVLDPRGRVVWRSGGEQPDALLERELRRALSGRVP